MQRVWRAKNLIETINFSTFWHPCHIGSFFALTLHTSSFPIFRIKLPCSFFFYFPFYIKVLSNTLFFECQVEVRKKHTTHPSFHTLPPFEKPRVNKWAFGTSDKKNGSRRHKADGKKIDEILLSFEPPFGAIRVHRMSPYYRQKPWHRPLFLPPFPQFSSPSPSAKFRTIPIIGHRKPFFFV